MSIEKIEQKIGYKFKNKKLISVALTHSSYSNERKSGKHKSNERLEFLGDTVLGLVISEHIFKNYPNLPEGELTKIRSNIVCEVTLSECAKNIGLGKYLKFGRGEELTGGRNRASILADALEALIAAMYLDSDLKVTSNFILSIMDDIINDAVKGKNVLDYKTRLQEMIQVSKENHIHYELVDQTGPDHLKTFYSSVLLNNEKIGYGEGRSKKESEQMAAKQAIKELESRG